MIRALLISALAVLPTAAQAQTSAAPAGMVQVTLPPNSEVVVTPNDTITTKGTQLKQGAKFRISTVFDVMQDGVVLVPKGTPGEGTVTWMTSKGAFGKSGKMEVSFDWLELGGRRIALTGNHRQEGSGNTGATVATAVAAGVFSAFVTGRSAALANGQQLRARTAEPLVFNVPASAARVATGTIAAPTMAAPAFAPAPAASATPVSN